MNKVIVALNSAKGLVKVKDDQSFFIAKTVTVGQHEGREVVAVKDRNGGFHKVYIATFVTTTAEVLVGFEATEEVAIDFDEAELSKYNAPVAPANTESLARNNAVVAKQPLQFA
ncbi:hypothetical protein D3C85_1657450 [compost metagenome]